MSNGCISSWSALYVCSSKQLAGIETVSSPPIFPLAMLCWVRRIQAMSIPALGIGRTTYLMRHKVHQQEQSTSGSGGGGSGKNGEEETFLHGDLCADYGCRGWREKDDPGSTWGTRGERRNKGRKPFCWDSRPENLLKKKRACVTRKCKETLMKAETEDSEDRDHCAGL